MLEMRTTGRSVKRGAVTIQRRPVHRLVAGAAGPCGVPAAMTEAGLVTDEHRTGSVAW